MDIKIPATIRAVLVEVSTPVMQRPHRRLVTVTSPR
jgi:hypothetical protein